MCSRRGAGTVESWVREQQLADRVEVLATWPNVSFQGRTAVIVANAARDHVAAACWGLERGAAVLVEKPLAMSLPEAQALVRCAARCNGVLAAAHVLRFARYLETFGRLLASQESVRLVTLEWVDPAGEHRHGEVKQYDPSVPVYLDCLPHAVSALQGIFGVLPAVGGAPVVEAGGSRVVIPLTLDGRPCRVTLQRNGPARLRRVTVETGGGAASLDFSSEPGTIQLGQEVVSGDDQWAVARRPLASMLTAFFEAAAGGAVDPRLSLDAGLTACLIGDAISPAYQASVMSWLADRLATGSADDEAFCYAMAELLQEQGRLPEAELMARIQRLRLRGASHAERIDRLPGDLRRWTALDG